MKHEEKLQEAKRLYETANSDQKYVLETLFPELRESEDERIRKMLIEFFGKGAECNGSTNGISDKDILAWLEKQGEKPVEEMKEALRTEYEKGRADAIAEMQKEWSEEDETGLTNTIIMLKEGASLHFTKKDITKAIDWLESLKQRIGG